MLVSLTVRGICFAALCLACLLPSRALQAEPGQVHTAPVLNVATLNIAHGRGTSYNQMLTSGKQIRANLDAIADVLNQQAVDVLALQEADRASRWSGRFDHVEYLARAADYTHAYAGVHATSFLFSFGNAGAGRYLGVELVGHTRRTGATNGSRGSPARIGQRIHRYRTSRIKRSGARQPAAQRRVCQRTFNGPF